MAGRQAGGVAWRGTDLGDAEGEEALLGREHPREEGEGQGRAGEGGDALRDGAQRGEEAALADQVGGLRQRLERGREAEEEHGPAHAAAAAAARPPLLVVVGCGCCRQEREGEERDEGPQQRGEPAEVDEAPERDAV